MTDDDDEPTADDFYLSPQRIGHIFYRAAMRCYEKAVGKPPADPVVLETWMRDFPDAIVVAPEDFADPPTEAS